MILGLIIIDKCVLNIKKKFNSTFSALIQAELWALSANNRIF